MLTRMPPWKGRAATLGDGRRVGAMKMGEEFRFEAPDVRDAQGVVVAHGGHVAGKTGDVLVCERGVFMVAQAVQVMFDADALAAVKDEAASAALLAHFAANPVRETDLGVPRADGA